MAQTKILGDSFAVCLALRPHGRPVKSAHSYHAAACFCWRTLTAQQHWVLLFPLAANLTQTLTNHEGGVSLEGIKRTLPLSLLRPSLQPQLSVSKRLPETKGEREEREKLVERGKKEKVCHSDTVQQRAYIYIITHRFPKYTTDIYTFLD